MYHLDALIKAFSEHGEKCEEDKARVLKEFEESYPGEEIPDHMLDPFNICFALHSICIELKKLKDKSFP